MAMEKSKVLIQFLVIFRQFGDVLSFLYARRLRGYTATAGLSNYVIKYRRFRIFSINPPLSRKNSAKISTSEQISIFIYFTHNIFVSSSSLRYVLRTEILANDFDN